MEQITENALLFLEVRILRKLTLHWGGGGAKHHHQPKPESQ